jgi:hypothetical protein
MNTILFSPILHIALMVNRFFLQKLIFVFVLFTSFTLSNKATAVVVVIEGATTFVCPKKSVTYTARTFNETFGFEVYSCDIRWNVYQGTQIIGGGNGTNFTFTFPDVGVYKIEASADGCDPISFGDGIKTITTTSRVPIPSPISGPAMCSSGQSYTYITSPSLASIFLPTGNCYYHYPYLWTAPAGWSINGAGNTKITNETVSISAPVNTPAGSYIISVSGMLPKVPSPNPNNPNDFFISTPKTFSVQIGPFSLSQVSVSGAAMVCNGNSYTYTANVPTGHQNGYTYSWTYPSGWTVQNVSTNTITLFLPASNNSYGPVRVSVNNGCGTTPLTGLTVFPCSYMMSLGDFKIYPNPSSGDLFVEYNVEENQLREPILGESPTQQIKPVNTLFKVDIFDRTNKLVGTGESKGNKVYLDTKGFQPGTYYLHIYSGKDVLRQQILIQN